MMDVAEGVVAKCAGSSDLQTAPRKRTRMRVEEIISHVELHGQSESLSFEIIYSETYAMICSVANDLNK